MVSIANFVCAENVSSFVDQLQRECEPAKREMLRQLLLDEENKFASRAARLDLAERYLAEGASRIARQEAVVERLRRNGSDPSAAERTLTNFLMIQDLFADFRRAALEGLDRAQL